MQSQTTSLELSKRMKELGAEQKSIYWWYHSIQKNTPYIILNTKRKMLGYISAFTTNELLEMLGKKFRSLNYYEHTTYGYIYEASGIRHSFTYASTPQESLGLLWCYLKENNFI